MMVKGSVNGNTESFLTRNGSFMVDNEGFISTPGGLRLQGFAADARQHRVQRPTSWSATSRRPRGHVEHRPARQPRRLRWDQHLRPGQPGRRATATSVTLYDNLGNAIDADVHYVKTADNTWEYHVMVDSDDVAGGTPGEAQVIGTGSMSFDENGALTDATAADISFTPQGPSARASASRARAPRSSRARRPTSSSSRMATPRASSASSTSATTA